MNAFQATKKTPVFSIASRTLMLASSLLLIALLAGCSAISAGEEVLERLDRIEEELEALRGSESASDNSSANDGSGSSSSGSSGSETGTGSTGSSSSSGATGSSYDELSASLSNLTTRVEEAIAASEEVSVPTDASARPQAYYEAKSPLKALEDELDLLEDSVEYAERAGSITYEQMWELERSIDELDDRLDRAEDALERRMGVHD